MVFCLFFFQAEDGIRDLVRSRGLGDVYKRQGKHRVGHGNPTVGLLHLVRQEQPAIEVTDRTDARLSLIHI